MSTFVDYLGGAEEPDAEEATSYGVPAFKLSGRPLLGVVALSKGTVPFTAGSPLPDDVVRDLVRFRRAEILG